MSRDDINMTNENEIINLNPTQDHYKPISTILNYKLNTGDFLKDFLEKTQKVSTFIKKIKLEEDPKYFETQSKEYTKQLQLAKMRIEKILVKSILWTSKKSDKDRDIDVKK